MNCRCDRVLILCACLAFRAVGHCAEIAPLFHPEPDRPTSYRDGQTNGEWAAWVEWRLAGSAMARALKHEQKLYVCGPTQSRPRHLLTQTSSGGIQYWLREDGVLVFQPVGGIPRVAFPGTEEPRLIESPRPTKTNSFYRPPYWSLNLCWFSGPALIYESSNGYAGTDYLMGFFLIDATNKTVSPGRICVELKRPDQPGEKNPEHPGDSSPQVWPGRILFVGTHLLWENQGWPHAVRNGVPASHWRTRVLRAFDLESNRMLSGGDIPQDLLARNKEAVERVFGPDSTKPKPPPR